MMMSGRWMDYSQVHLFNRGGLCRRYYAVHSAQWIFFLSFLTSEGIRLLNNVGCLPLAVTTYFCLTRGSKRSLVGTDRSVIRRWLERHLTVLMRLYLAMLLYSWIEWDQNAFLKVEFFFALSRVLIWKTHKSKWVNLDYKCLVYSIWGALSWKFIPFDQSEERVLKFGSQYSMVVKLTITLCCDWLSCLICNTEEKNGFDFTSA